MTKKLAVAAGLLLVLALPAGAASKSMELGLKGGVNLANLSYDPESPYWDPEMKLGLAAGGALSFVLSPTMRLDGEVLYVQKGATLGGPDNIECAGDVDINLTYVGISPMLRFKMNSQKATPYFMGGIEFAFLLEAEYDRTFECNGDEESDTVDAKDYFEDTDMSVTVGAGLEFPSGGSAFFLEGRYVLGLSDISKQDDSIEVMTNGEGEPEIKTTGIYLLAGLRF